MQHVVKIIESVAKSKNINLNLKAWEKDYLAKGLFINLMKWRHYVNSDVGYDVIYPPSFAFDVYYNNNSCTWFRVIKGKADVEIKPQHKNKGQLRDVLTVFREKLEMLDEDEIRSF